MSNFRVILIFSISLFIFFSCALKEAPSGGPEDTIKPTILGVIPPPGSTEIPADTRFHILFSKPMNQDRTVNAVFLSPVFWDYPEYQWKGKELIVIPPEDLAENKTYVLTIGADATGHHGNQMGSSYSFAFSTGSVIDKGVIEGSIYLEKGKSSSFDIWAYSLEDGATGLFLADIPDYATQVDSLNRFKIESLAAGNYVIVAVEDRNDDLFWDPTSESIGLPPTIVKLDTGASYEGIVLNPIRRDTILAVVSKVAPIDNRKITVELSQPVIEKTKLDQSHFQIMAADSTILPIEGAFIGEEGRLILETALQESGKSYKVKPLALYSLWGIPFDTTGGRFTGSPEDDTTGPELLYTVPPGGSRSSLKVDYVEMVFSERIKVLGFSETVSMVADSTDTLSFIPHWEAPNKVRLNFVASVPRERDIDVILDPPEIYDVHGNQMTDSVLAIAIRFPPADTAGSVIIGTSKPGNLAGELGPWGSARGEVYTENAGDNGRFYFSAVLPGTYYFKYFDDSDSNGVWTPGAVNPFIPAEWFFYYKDSVDVRARWETNIGQID